MFWPDESKVDETSDVSVIVPGTTQAPAAGKQPAPIDEAYGTPRTGNVGVAEMTDARAVVTQASKAMMPAVSAAGKRRCGPNIMMFSSQKIGLEDSRSWPRL
jgi:hypothetical protein